MRNMHEKEFERRSERYRLKYMALMKELYKDVDNENTVPDGRSGTGEALHVADPAKDKIFRNP